jgi:autotransporter-associated beta strand protein
MKLHLLQKSLVALLIATGLTGAKAQTTFFSDGFTNSSTINSATPAKPTNNATSYQTVANKGWAPVSSIAAKDLRFGIAATSSGIAEIQALFSTNAIALTQVGDYLQLTVTFTNAAGILTSNDYVGFGLYNSGNPQVYPIAGGMNGNLNSVSNYVGTAGNGYGCKTWKGYIGIVAGSGTGNPNSYKSSISTRPDQSSQADSADNRNQDLINSGGSTGSSYLGGANLYSAVTTPAVVLTNGSVYTEVLIITLNGSSSLAITNTLFNGPTTSGAQLQQFGGIATNANYLTGGFDSLAIGWYKKNGDTSNVMDIASIQVTGSVTPPAAPPTITLQPFAEAVPSGASCAFDVAATGISLTYQWHRNGTNLLNGGNISGATSSELLISPVGTGDYLSGASGYYCTVTGAGNLSTNSTTNSLTLATAKNLVWAGVGTDWDLNTTANWLNGASAATFNFGDAVTFDDTASGLITSVNMTNVPTGYLSASSITIDGSTGYTFSGSGGFAGPGTLIDKGSGLITINNANTYTGGTIISNASAYVVLGNSGSALGTGPLTLALATTGKLEVQKAGNATSGIGGDVIVQDDFTIQFDVAGTYAGVFLGNISGTSGKTLTLSPAVTTSQNRIRAAGTNTICNAYLNLSDASVLFAPYQASGSQTYNGVISGPGAMMNKGNLTYFNGANTYSGGMNLAAGAVGLGIDSAGGTDASVTSGPIGTGPLLLMVDSTSATTGSGQIFAAGSARTLGNTIEFPTGTNNLTLIIGGTNNLTLSGSFYLNGNDNITTNAFTARTVQVNNTNAATTFSGVISDNSGSTSFSYGLIKSGNGSLYLDGANTYAGITTNSAGLLAGAGSLSSSVVVLTNASIGGGSAATIGTLSITGNLTLTNGNGFFRVNRSGSSSDLVSVTGNITNSGIGTITVTNLGATLQMGDTFHIFNKGVTSGGTLTVIGGGVAWSNNLAAAGTIVVATPPDTGVQLTAPASVMVSANITNTVTITNVGPGTAFSLVVTDALPASVKFVSATSGGTTNANVGQVVWSGFNLAANTATNFTLIFSAPAVAGNLTNTATVASSVNDLSLANNTATNVIAVTSVIIPTVPPYVGSFSLVGANLVINGTNGVNGGTYYLLETTNLVTPLSQWKAVATNVVNTNGLLGAFAFTGTNAITVGVGQQFYILSSTNNH